MFFIVVKIYTNINVVPIVFIFLQIYCNWYSKTAYLSCREVLLSCRNRDRFKNVINCNKYISIKTKLQNVIQFFTNRL